MKDLEKHNNNYHLIVDGTEHEGVIAAISKENIGIHTLLVYLKNKIDGELTPKDAVSGMKEMMRLMNLSTLKTNRIRNQLLLFQDFSKSLTEEQSY